MKCVTDVVTLSTTTTTAAAAAAAAAQTACFMLNEVIYLTG